MRVLRPQEGKGPLKAVPMLAGKRVGGKNQDKTTKTTQALDERERKKSRRG